MIAFVLVSSCLWFSQHFVCRHLQSVKPKRRIDFWRQHQHRPANDGGLPDPRSTNTKTLVESAPFTIGRYLSDSGPQRSGLAVTFHNSPNWTAPCFLHCYPNYHYINDTSMKWWLIKNRYCFALASHQHHIYTARHQAKSLLVYIIYVFSRSPKQPRNTKNRGIEHDTTRNIPRESTAELENLES